MTRVFRRRGVRRFVTVGTADRTSLRRLSDGFRHFSQRTALAVGRPEAFILAAATVVVWATVGPSFHYSDTWQLTINTGTTIITFLMVFLIQNTQNRDAQVMQLKLDELIRAVEQARDELVDMEDLSDEDLRHLQRQFETLRKSAEAARSARVALAPER